MLERLRERLSAADLLVGEAVASRPTAWNDSTPLNAWAYVTPRSTEEVAAVLRWCQEFERPIVIHGGTTGLSGGARTTRDDLVLSLSRMNAIEEIDVVGRTVVVQAGCVLQTLQQAVANAGLYLPLDLGARGSCTIGGNVATNAGGLNVIRWGMTRALVLGLEVVLADGRVVSSMNRMLKNNTGYDLKQLFIGSEGTLGVITRVILRLVERPQSCETALVALRDLDAVARLLKLVDSKLGGALSSFEVLWRDYYRVTASAAARSGTAAPLADSHAFYALIEMQGADPVADEARFQAAIQAAVDEAPLVDAVIAKSASERARLWALREGFEGFRQFKPLVSYDVSLPIPTMQGYVDRVERALRTLWPSARLFVVGHLGDGNLHLVVAPGASAAGLSAAECHALCDAQVYPPLRALGGAISAEHGVGADKIGWIGVTRSEPELELMRQIKHTLDPMNILNRGKVLAAAAS
jgi:FAD/FMN-containing dehydrogenase